jgi:hypothetical protein
VDRKAPEALLGDFSYLRFVLEEQDLRRHIKASDVIALFSRVFVVRKLNYLITRV